MNNITIVIITKNEEKNIANCIDSVVHLANRIVVVDSYSTDKTVEIARDLGAEVYMNEFINYSIQSNWALDNTKITTKWILRLDADEILSKELSDEIQECLKEKNEDIKGYFMRYRLIFMGKQLKYGGISNNYILRLFQNGYGRVEENEMDEHTVVVGKTKKLKKYIIHNDYKDLNHWINKHNWYSGREVEDYFNYRTRSTNKLTVEAKIFGNQAEKKRWIKHNLYYKIPIVVRGPIYFLYRYILKLGILDGKEGFIFHFLQAMWYRTLVDAKILEAKKAKVLGILD